MTRAPLLLVATLAFGQTDLIPSARWTYTRGGLTTVAADGNPGGFASALRVPTSTAAPAAPGCGVVPSGLVGTTNGGRLGAAVPPRLVESGTRAGECSGRVFPGEHEVAVSMGDKSATKRVKVLRGGDEVDTVTTELSQTAPTSSP